MHLWINPHITVKQTYAMDQSCLHQQPAFGAHVVPFEWLGTSSTLSSTAGVSALYVRHWRTKQSKATEGHNLTVKISFTST